MGDLGECMFLSTPGNSNFWHLIFHVVKDELSSRIVIKNELFNVNSKFKSFRIHMGAIREMMKTLSVSK